MLCLTLFRCFISNRGKWAALYTEAIYARHFRAIGEIIRVGLSRVLRFWLLVHKRCLWIRFHLIWVHVLVTSANNGHGGLTLFPFPACIFMKPVLVPALRTVLERSRPWQVLKELSTCPLWTLKLDIHRKINRVTCILGLSHEQVFTYMDSAWAGVILFANIYMSDVGELGQLHSVITSGTLGSSYCSRVFVCLT